MTQQAASHAIAQQVASAGAALLIPGWTGEGIAYVGVDVRAK